MGKVACIKEGLWYTHCLCQNVWTPWGNVRNTQAGFNLKMECNKTFSFCSQSALFYKVNDIIVFFFVKYFHLFIFPSLRQYLLNLRIMLKVAIRETINTK